MNKVALLNFVAAVASAFSRWIDSVVDTVCTLLSRFISPRTVRLVENQNGYLTIQLEQETVSAGQVQIVDGQIAASEPSTLVETLSGSRIDLLLRPDLFVFRPLELPNRATEFMSGIVRSQIDRLTPWNPSNAAFGWSQPRESDAENMVVTVAVTTLDLVRPYVRAITDAGAHSIAVFATPPGTDSGTDPIKIWEERGRGIKEATRIRQIIVAMLAATGITAIVALGADTILSANLTAQQKELARQVSGIRAARVSASTASQETKQALQRRKHDTPVTVLVLDALAKILPDDTYVTELRIEGNKLRLTGTTRDAPSLIGLIEQSGRFTRATFFAQTTRSSSSSVDQFNIEAIIQPLGASS
jgi:general secretion pathway protein L